jgi:hypothetical protein
LAALVVLTATMVTIAIFAALYWWLIGAPYRNAESNIRAELDRLQLDPGRLATERYADGVCLDNCPVLTQTYDIQSSTSCAVIHRTTATLRAHGYKIGSRYSLGARRGNYTIRFYGRDPCPPWNEDARTLPSDELLLEVEYGPGA